MFDLRYHVASLAAVLVALAVGIVVGVAIASGGEVERQTADLLQQQRDDLRDRLAASEERLQAAQAAGAADAAFAEALYLPLVEDLLAGRRVGLLQLGGSGSAAANDVEDVLRTAGATGPEVTLSLPLDPARLDAVLGEDPATARFVGSEHREALGAALGSELATAGGGPVWDAVAGLLGTEARGLSGEALDGAVVVRAWEATGTGPPEPTSPEAEQTEAFLRGLLSGIAAGGIPVVGAERLTDSPSDIPFYAEGGISSVDDVGRPGGDIALALLLAGAEPGRYGAKETATDGPVPRLPEAVGSTGDS